MATTKRPMVRIHDTATDEIIDREMNDEEYTQYLLDLEAQAIAEAEAAAIAEAKASAEAKLTAIGLTTEEIAALKG